MDTLVAQMVPVAIAAAPGALLAWVLLARWRQRSCPAVTAAFTALLDTAIVLIGAAVLWLVFAPVAGSHTSTLHPLPGEEIAEALDRDEFWPIAGNLVLLTPLAAMCPIRVPALRSITRTTMAALMVSIMIETIQYAMHAGRISSTDDVLLNTLGAAAAANLTRSLWHTTQPMPPAQRTATPARSPGYPASADRRKTDPGHPAAASVAASRPH